MPMFVLAKCTTTFQLRSQGLLSSFGNEAEEVVQEVVQRCRINKILSGSNWESTTLQLLLVRILYH